MTREAKGIISESITTDNITTYCANECNDFSFNLEKLLHKMQEPKVVKTIALSPFNIKKIKDSTRYSIAEQMNLLYSISVIEDVNLPNNMFVVEYSDGSIEVKKT